MDAAAARMRDHWGNPEDLTLEKIERVREIFENAQTEWSGFRYLKNKSAAPDSDCPPGCESCRDQFRPKEYYTMSVFNNPIKRHNDNQAAAEIKNVLLTIDGNIQYLRRTVNNYGNTILKRWEGRSKDKRKGLILAADPHTCRQKHAEIAIFHRIEDTIKSTVIAGAGIPKGFTILDQQDIALTPYLDLVSLSEDLRLISLIHYRAHHDPAEWFRFDCRQLKKFFHIGSLDTAHNPHCVVAHGDKFGELVHWEKDAGHKWDIIGYPLARLALKAQSKLTSFLCKMIELLLENELDSASQGRDKWDALATIGFKKADPDGTISAYFEHAFAPPPRFDATRVASLVRTRFNAAQDDLELLQTNPIHARHSIDRMADYSQRLRIPDKDRKHFLIKTTLRSLAVGSMWRWALGHACRLEELSLEFDGQIDEWISLPAEYEEILDFLEVGLEAAYKSELLTLGTLVGPMPTFWRHFSFERYPRLHLHTPKRTLFKTDPLLWNVIQLLGYGEEYTAPSSFHFAFIDELVTTSSKDAERVDQIFHDHLSDLAAIDEVLTSIKYHRYRKPLGTNSLNLENVLEWLGADCDRVAPTSIVRNRKGDNRLWSKLEAFRKTPMPPAKTTEENISRLKDLHKALDSYWCQVRKVNENELRRLEVAEEVVLAYVNDVSMGQRDDFKAAVKEGHEEMLRIVREKETNKKTQNGPSTTLPDLLQHVYTFGSTQPKETDVLTTRKSKVKTRPQENSSIVADRTTDGLESLTLIDTAEKTAVAEKQSLVIFNRMFARAASKQSLTKWTEFIAALKDAGFSATHSGGSVVTFTDERTGKGAIAFHRPHPSPKIEPNKLRRWGWRLTKWFGWGEDTFVLGSK